MKNTGESGKPTGVIALVILQLLAAIVVLLFGVPQFMTLLAATPPLPFLLMGTLPLIVGFIGLLLIYGLWTLKKWAWFGAIIVNIIAILIYIVNPILFIIQISISVIIVVYAFTPGVKAHFR